MKSLFLVIQSRSLQAGKIIFDAVTVAYIRTRLLAGTLTVLIMLFLKWHYSVATVAQLDWILAPSAKLLAWFSSANPVLESGVGYVDFAKGIIVAPGCAGVNFMIMAFGLAAFCGLHRIRRLRIQLVWLILAFAAAYGYTLLVNTLRIAMSMALYDADVYSTWLTTPRVHRLSGVGVYFGALWVFFLGLRQMMALLCGRFHSRKRERTHSSGWLVLGWYLLVAVGIPFANGAWKQGPAAFVEHSATVILAGLALWALVMIINRVFICREQWNRL